MMNLKKVTVIVPRLPPSVDGLGDYGMSLAQQLKKNYQLDTEFIVADGNWQGRDNVHGFKATKLKKKDSKSLVDILPHGESADHLVLLHYVGYGYARRGSPVWLIKALANWKKQNKKAKLITMFHELYAFGPIWTSQFWTSPLQRYLAKQLALLSDDCITSKKIYSKIINNYSDNKHKDIQVLPVFSNIGELHNPKKLSERKNRLVVFGSKVPRSRVYEQSISHLEKLCKQFDLQEIIDIGSPLAIEIPTINGISVTLAGQKSSEEISQILSESLIGYINYPTEYLAKSGIFAAYCSHGVLIVASRYQYQKIDSVVENVHYWVGDQGPMLSLQDAQKIADSSFLWYQGHDLNEHGKAFSKILKED